MQLITAEKAKDQLDKARPTEVDPSTMYKFNQLVQAAIKAKTNKINQDDMRKLELFLNEKQRVHFTQLRKEAGFKHFYEAGDPREPMSYDIEYWYFD